MTSNSVDPFPDNKKNCLISPVGKFDDKLLEEIALNIQNKFGLNTHVKSLLNSVDFAYDKNRNQYHSTPILKKLTKVLDPEFDKVIALTSVDLFIPILTHVYGEAQLGGTSCIVSTARLSEGLQAEDGLEPFFSRVVKEAQHELGHTFKLVHCKDPQCIMHYCRCIGDVDKKNNDMCRYCTILLGDQTGKRPEGKKTVPSKVLPNRATKY